MEIESIEKGRKKYRIKRSDGICFQLYPGELRSLSLEAGSELTAEQEEALFECLLQRGKERAYYLIGRRAYSVGELRAKLLADGYPDEVIEEIGRQLSEYRYLDDEQYGEQLVRRQITKSRREVQMLLSQKAIDRELQETLLEQYDEQMCLYRLMQKKLSGKEVSDVIKAKIFRYCAGHGFSYELIQTVWRQCVEEREIKDEYDGN